MPQYDAFAEQYLECKSAIKKQYTEEWCFRQYAAAVKGRTALDLACGSGFYTRILKELGATQVVGVDISSEQIRLAQEHETQDARGITYIVADAAGSEAAQSFGRFDLVTGIYLLDYAPTRQVLEQMCETIHACLREGGKAIIFMDNPNAVLPTNPKYGLTLESTTGAPLQEGQQRRLRFFNANNEEVVTFTNYFWTVQTYEQCIRAAGFTKFEWHAPTVSPQGLTMFDQGFWQEFVSNPDFLMLTCEK